jgi:hypothetical protein
VVEVLTEVPLEIEPDPDAPECATVRVVCGVASGELRCVLDSGARQTEIVDGATLIANRRFDSVHSRKIFSASLVERGDLPELSLAGVRRTVLPVTITPPDTHAENLLGIDFLHGHAWRISLASRLLASVNVDAEDVPWRIRRGPHGHLCLDLRWGMTGANAIWDTGAGITVVDRSFAAEHPDLFVSQGRATGTDGTSSQETDLALMRGPVIESLRFTDSIAAIVDLSEPSRHHGERIDLILGYPLISQADWIVDLRLDRWSAQMGTSRDIAADHS